MRTTRQHYIIGTLTSLLALATLGPATAPASNAGSPFPVGSSLGASLPPIMPDDIGPPGPGGPPGTSGPPVELIAPMISGVPEVGTPLGADTGVWSGVYPMTYAYTWSDCTASGACTPIAGANAQTYTVQINDAKFYIEVTIVVSNAAGSAAPVTTPAVGPVVPPIFYIPPPSSRTPPPPATFGATPTCYAADPKNAGIFVYLYPSNGSSAQSAAALSLAPVAVPASKIGR